MEGVGEADCGSLQSLSARISCSVSLLFNGPGYFFCRLLQILFSFPQTLSIATVILAFSPFRLLLATSASTRYYPVTMSYPATVIALGVVLPAMDIIAVTLRFYARKKQKARLMMDDWLVVPALVIHPSSLALLILSYVILSYMD